MVRHSMRRAILILTVLGGLVAAPAAWAIFPETPVLTSVRNEYAPTAGMHAGGDELLAFARSRSGARDAWDAYLRRTTPGGFELVTLNDRGMGFAGGIDSPRVVYQQIVGNQSNLRFYDIDTGTRAAPPAGVNTRHWEFRPTISGDWLLFGRDGPRFQTRVVLANLSTGGRRVLAYTGKRTVFIYAGQVAGTWAVWTRCAKKCNVFRYNILTGGKLRLPKPLGRGNGEQYAASVLPTGVVYVARSGKACGASVKLVRFLGASDAAKGTVIARLPRGRDLVNSHVRSNADGSADVFYDRRNCADRVQWNVYKVLDPDPDVPPGRSSSRDSVSASMREGERARGKYSPRSHPDSRSS